MVEYSTDTSDGLSDVQLDSDGNVSVAAGDVDHGSSDPDGDPLTFLLDGQPALVFTCSDEGPTNVTLSVADGKGGSDTSALVSSAGPLVTPADC